MNSDPFFASRSEQLAALVVRHALPTVSAHREFTVAGGLFSYGTEYFRHLSPARHLYGQVLLKGRSQRSFRSSNRQRSN